MKVYTMGYTGMKMEAIREFVMANDLIVIDTRFSPFSRAPMWTKRGFQEGLGVHYVHLKQFGNRNYREAGMENVQINDMEGGIAVLESIMDDLDSPSGIVLMCACPEHAGCHRTLVAKAVARHFRVDEEEIVNLRKPDLIPEGSEAPKKRMSKKDAEAERLAKEPPLTLF